MNWEAVKHLEDHFIAVYELVNNRFVGPLPGKFREVNQAEEKYTYDEPYSFMQISDSNIVLAAFRKDELLFVERK